MLLPPPRSCAARSPARLRNTEDPELHHLMVSSAKADFDLHIPNEPLFVGLSISINGHLPKLSEIGQDHKGERKVGYSRRNGVEREL
ncbi:hypothetical protein llap_12888 [Limosa lapponica baueri]|uniref:Uncharacterized protein n=1 Tax=Limosa lapponica baueri TaxID=1758121 RepID=A0A2I0TSM8_LIMLA|nr:hypothetical protein llap_12888 [Limosa lapponica baueri]